MTRTGHANNESRRMNRPRRMARMSKNEAPFRKKSQNDALSGVPDQPDQIHNVRECPGMSRNVEFFRSPKLSPQALSRVCHENRQSLPVCVVLKGNGEFPPPPVILAAAGIQSPGPEPRRLCQLGRAEWTGRRLTWTTPAYPHQVGLEEGLRIPTAARVTGGFDDN